MGFGGNAVFQLFVKRILGKVINFSAVRNYLCAASQDVVAIYEVYYSKSELLDFTATILPRN